MSKKSKDLIQPIDGIIKQLEAWAKSNPGYNSYFITALSAEPDDPEHPFSVISAARGTNGQILASLEDFTKDSPEVKEILQILCLRDSNKHAAKSLS